MDKPFHCAPCILKTNLMTTQADGKCGSGEQCNRQSGRALLNQREFRAMMSQFSAKIPAQTEPDCRDGIARMQASPSLGPPCSFPAGSNRVDQRFEFR